MNEGFAAALCFYGCCAFPVRSVQACGRNESVGICLRLRLQTRLSLQGESLISKRLLRNIVPQGAGEELDGGAGGTNDVLQRADVPRRPAGCARAHVAERCAQRGPRGRQHAHEERERSGVPSADARMQHQ
jgi:hypothetical protein